MSEWPRRVGERAKGTWVVTGAASGIGREYVRQLAARGETIALWDRDRAGLEATAALVPDARTHVFEVDVTDPEAVRQAAQRTLETLGQVAHAVHCAGVLRVGAADTMDPAAYDVMIRVNYLGSVHVAQALLPQLRDADGRATLTLVASVAGLRGFPELAGYCASKFAVVGFGQALRTEEARKPGKVDVRVLCPPPGDTPMVRNLERLPPIYKLSKMFTAEQIAEAGLAGLERRPWIMLVDLNSKALHRVGAVLPGLVDQIIRFAAR